LRRIFRSKREKNGNKCRRSSAICISIKSSYGDQIKEDEKGMVSSEHGKYMYKIKVRKSIGKRPLRRPKHIGRIILQ